MVELPIYLRVLEFGYDASLLELLVVCMIKADYAVYQLRRCAGQYEYHWLW